MKITILTNVSLVAPLTFPNWYANHLYAGRGGFSSLRSGCKKNMRCRVKGLISTSRTFSLVSESNIIKNCVKQEETTEICHKTLGSRFCLFSILM